MHLQSALVTPKSATELHRRIKAVSQLLFILAGSLCAQVSAPQIGLVRYADGGVYPLLGVQGNYVLGTRRFDSVDALSFSGKSGLLARGGMLLLVNESLDVVATSETGESAPLVGVDVGLDSAIAWLPARKQLMHWNGTAFVSVPVLQEQSGGTLFSISKQGQDRATLLSRAADGGVEEVTVSLATGAVLSRTLLTGIAGDVYRQGNLLLSVQGGQLLTFNPKTGTSKAVGLRAADVVFERVSATCVHVWANRARRDWMVHLIGDQASVYELPIPATPSAQAAAQ